MKRVLANELRDGDFVYIKYSGPEQEKIDSYFYIGEITDWHPDSIEVTTIRGSDHIPRKCCRIQPSDSINEHYCFFIISEQEKMALIL